MKCLLPIVFLSVLLISCSENINRLEPFRWESTDPDFDAVTLELEQDFMDYLPVDSLSEKVEMLNISRKVATPATSDIYAAITGEPDCCRARDIRTRH